MHSVKQSASLSLATNYKPKEENCISEMSSFRHGGSFWELITWEVEGQELCKFEANLGYTVSSRLAWTTDQDPVSKTETNKQKMLPTVGMLPLSLSHF